MADAAQEDALLGNGLDTGCQGSPETRGLVMKSRRRGERLNRGPGRAAGAGGGGGGGQGLQEAPP